MSSTKLQGPALGPLARVFLFAITLLGIFAGVTAMYAAWEHNPQGEFHDETGVHWADWCGVGLSWFAVVSGIPWVIAGVITAVARRHRS
jgi:hypothetical protein